METTPRDLPAYSAFRASCPSRPGTLNVQGAERAHLQSAGPGPAVSHGAAPAKQHNDTPRPQHSPGQPPKAPEAALRSPGSNMVDAVAFSPDGKTLAAGNCTTNCASKGFSPDGKVLADGNYDGSTYLRNLATGKVIATFADPGKLITVQAIAFTPDGKTLATGDQFGTCGTSRPA
jgi:hypothetical protein